MTAMANPLAVDLSGIYFATDDGGIARLPLKGASPCPSPRRGTAGRRQRSRSTTSASSARRAPPLYRVPKGGDPETLIATDKAPIRAIDRGDDGLWLALEDGTVVRRGKSPGGAETTIARGKQANPQIDLAHAAGRVYWGTDSGIVRRAP